MFVKKCARDEFLWKGDRRNRSRKRKMLTCHTGPQTFSAGPTETLRLQQPLVGMTQFKDFISTSISLWMWVTLERDMTLDEASPTFIAGKKDLLYSGFVSAGLLLAMFSVTQREPVYPNTKYKWQLEGEREREWEKVLGFTGYYLQFLRPDSFNFSFSFLR